jgi:hypothetical protein
MTDNKQQRQDASPAGLSPEEYETLRTPAQPDRQPAQPYDRLQDVDGILKAAPAPRQAVPVGLTDKIMARIAEPETLPIPRPLHNGRAVAFGLVLGALVGFAVLVALSLAVLALLGTSSALSGVALGVIGVAVALYAALNSVIGGAGQLLASYPLIFAALLLIPLAWAGLWRLGRSQTKGMVDAADE